MRVVVDTNLLVSGFLWGGTPAALIDAAIGGRFTLLTTEILITELDDVLNRPKFAKTFEKAGLTPASVVENYHQIAEIVSPSPIPSGSVRDSDDEAILACAIGGKADYIVSGDLDLLELEQFQDIPVITAKRCIEILESIT